MASTKLYYLNQYFTTTLSVVGGIDNSQTTGIVVSGVSGLDINKPGIALIGYADPLDTSTAEWVTYTSINGSNELQGVTRGAEGFSAKSHANSVTIAFPISESHVNNINAMFDTTGLDIAEIATPANPDAGRNKLYFKNDDKLYKLTSGGTETEIGAPTLCRARVRLSADMASLTSTTATKITFDTEDFDTGNNFASNKFTVTTAGYYRVYLQCYLYTGTGSSLQYAFIYKNGAAIASSTDLPAGVPALSQVMTLVHLNATDYIEGYVQKNASGWNLYADSTLTYMIIEQVTAD